jgi:DNA-binding transcriptional ArsR family regulator
VQRRAPDHSLPPVDPIPDIHTFASIDQLRVFSSVVRQRMLELLARQPLTVTQLGSRLDISAARAQYHVRRLEQAGLVRLVARYERRGAPEKYYRAVAHRFQGPADMLQSLDTAARLGVLGELLRSMVSRVSTDLAALPPTSDEQGVDLALTSLFLTPEEFADLMHRMHAMLDSYRRPRGAAGEREHILLRVAYRAPGNPLSGKEDDPSDRETAR